MATRTFKHGGLNHPLVEAEFDTAFKVFKSDRKKAVIGDPADCIEAKGLKRLPNVAFAHIGSGGDGYVGFKDESSPTGIKVRHFLIPAKAAKVRDIFETKGAPSSQVLMLKAPTNGRTLSHRSMLGKRRREEVKKGSPVKSRGPQKNKRIHRLGVPPRPRAKIVKGETSFAE